jgi:hypothetical protein
MAARKTLDDNPLDALIPAKRTQAASAASHKGLEPTGTTPRPEPVLKAHKFRFAVYVRPDLAERVKNAVYYTPGMNIAVFGEEAFERYVATLEKQHGGPFEPRKGEMRIGRPMK